MIVRVPVSRPSRPPIPLGLLVARGRRGRPLPRGFMGLGDCAPFVGDVYGGVQYCRDNATGSLVPCSAPSCGSGGGVVPSNTPVYTPPSYTGSPSQSVPFGLSTSTIPTLDAFMQNWLSAITAVAPDSLGISSANDLMSSALSMAQRFCQEAGSPPDCANMAAVAAAYGAKAVSLFQNVPSSQFNQTSYTPYSGPAGSPGSPVSYTTPPLEGITATVVMKNLTRAGSDSSYQVGDQWQLTISGQPGAAVTSSASQNGKALGTTPFGALNSQGQMVLTGAMTAGQIGSWQESWNAGNSPAVSISFSVAAAPSGSSGSTGTGTGTGDGGKSTPPPVTAPAFTLPDLSSIPSWAWYAGGGLLLFLMVKK